MTVDVTGHAVEAWLKERVERIRIYLVGEDGKLVGVGVVEGGDSRDEFLTHRIRDGVEVRLRRLSPRNAVAPGLSLRSRRYLAHHGIIVSCDGNYPVVVVEDSLSGERVLITRMEVQMMLSRRQVLITSTSGFTSVLAGCSRLSFAPPQIEDRPCPPGEFVHAPVSCSHSDTEHGVAVHVSPSTIRNRSEIDDFRIEIRNRSQTELSLDAFRWRIWTKSGTNWERFDKNSESNQPEDRVTLAPNRHVSWTGLKTVFDAFDDHSPTGLYTAVLPVQVQNKRVNCVCLFRILGVE